MISAIALVVRILVNPLSNVYQKQLCQKSINPLFISFLTYLILTTACLVPLCTPFFTINWFQFDVKVWLIAALIGLIGALGNWFLVEALKCGDLSVLGPINSYKSVVSILFALVLIGEVPTFVQFAGILLIISGSYFVIETEGEKFNFSIFLRRDIKYRFCALVLTALEAVFIKKIILLAGITASFILWCGSSCLFSLILLVVCRRNLRNDIRNGYFNIGLKNFKTLLALAFCVFLMQFSTNIVFKNMNVSSALALFQLSVPISVLFGCKFFKEKNILKKFAGAVIMMLGSCVIILF